MINIPIGPFLRIRKLELCTVVKIVTKIFIFELLVKVIKLCDSFFTLNLRGILTHSRLPIQEPPTGFLSVESPTRAPRELDDEEKEDFGLVEESLAGLDPPVQEP